MKVLVTGAGGFLGVKVVERLLAHGFRDIRCLVRSTRGVRELEELSLVYPDARIEIVNGNLRSQRDAKSAVVGIDTVLHLAAALKGAAADMAMDSVVASRNLLDAAVTFSVRRLVLVSSFSVYSGGMKRGSLLDESYPLEQHPELRDPYAFTKSRQERIFWEYREKFDFELAVLRPGVIYGPGSGHFSGRVGLTIGGRFLHLGGPNVLPLTYVENCAEAVVVAATAEGVDRVAINVVDDDLPSCRQYLREYQRQVKRIKTIRVPYPCLLLLGRIVERYAERSHGQLPAIFTPYKVSAMWGGNRFTNAKLKSLGWKQIVPTSAAIDRTFTAFRRELESKAV